MSKVRLGILGYGNLGKGVEQAVKQNDDMELVAVYSRRDPATVSVATEGLAVKPAEALESGEEPLDVLVLCGGSATDLPEQTPHYAGLYNVVDSFDTHAKIPEHFDAVDAAAAGAARPRSFRAAGTRACSRSTGCWATASCRRAPTTRSGAAA